MWGEERGEDLERGASGGKTRKGGRTNGRESVWTQRAMTARLHHLTLSGAWRPPSRGRGKESWGERGGKFLTRLCGGPSSLSQTRFQLNAHRRKIPTSLRTFVPSSLSLHLQHNMSNGIVNGTGLENQFGESPRVTPLTATASLTCESPSPQPLSVSMEQNLLMCLLI